MKPTFYIHLALGCAVLFVLSPLATAADFNIVADAATSIANDEPNVAPGPNIVRADNAGKNKAYFRFYIGWLKGRDISSATLNLTLGIWYGGNAEKRFGVYVLKDGVDGDGPKDWDENTLTAANAPGNVLTDTAFNPDQTEKLGEWTIGNDANLKEGSPVVFSSPRLADAISHDTNGYITIMMTWEDGDTSSSCIQPRGSLGSKQPWLGVVTNDSLGGVDMLKPTFVVTSDVRQTISGYGTGIGPAHVPKKPGDTSNFWFTNGGMNLGSLSPERLKEFFKVEYTDTGSNTVRLWFYETPNDPTDKGIEAGDGAFKNFVMGYYDTGIIPAARAAGITRFILCTNPPERMWADKPTPDSFGVQPLSEAAVKDYPEYLAEFVARVKKEKGLDFYMVTIANEDLRITLRQWPLVVKNLRSALDARGLKNVKISGVDWPNFDNYASSRLKSIQDDPQAWKDLDVCNSHSYAMSATDDFYRQFVQGQGKELWITETAGGGSSQTSFAKSVCGHIMNDLNHGVSCWIYHEGGLAVHGDHTEVLLGYDPKGPDGNWLSFSPKYYYFKQLVTAFPVGTSMRRIWSSTLGDAGYPGWGTAKGLATGGRTPDGSWSFALLNTAENTEPDAKRTFTLAVEELATIPSVPVQVVRLGEGSPSDANPAAKATADLTYVPLRRKEEKAVISYGTITLDLGPNELVTLQSEPVKGKL